MAATTIAGMAHDGIDSVPEDGTWLLQKGERVTTAETSAKLDATLERINSDMRSSRTGNGTVVNVIEDPRRAGRLKRATRMTGKSLMLWWLIFARTVVVRGRWRLPMDFAGKADD